MISRDAVEQLANELHCNCQSDLGEVFDRLIAIQDKIEADEEARHEKAYLDAVESEQGG